MPLEKALLESNCFVEVVVVVIVVIYRSEVGGCVDTVMLYTLEKKVWLEYITGVTLLCTTTHIRSIICKITKSALLGKERGYKRQ